MSNRELMSWRDVRNCVLAAIAITLVICGGSYLGAGGPLPDAMAANSAVSQPVTHINLSNEQVRQKPAAAAVSPVVVHQIADVSRTYRVRPGDSLSTISARIYGSSKYWTGIYWANNSTIKYANVIYVGQNLTVPVNPHALAAPRVLSPASSPQPHRFATATDSTGSIPQPTVVSGGQSQHSTASGQLTPGQVGALWIEAGGPA